MSKSKTRLYVGRLNEQTRERDLEKLVRGFGKIREISVKRGYGFVEFYDARDADDAVYDLNGQSLHGERLIIEHAREPTSRREFGYSSRSRDASSYNRSSSYGQREYRRNPPVRTDHRVSIENLSSRINWQELKQIFGKVCDVTFTDVHKRKTGVGVIDFLTHDDLKIGMKKMDGTELNGKKIKLTIEEHQHSRSRSRSRSRDHRSKSRSPRRQRHRSRSKSPKRSRSNSKTREDDDHEGSRSRSRSKSNEAKSRSQSPEKDGEESNRESGHESGNESPVNRNDEEEEEDVQQEEDDE